MSNRISTQFQNDLFISKMFQQQKELASARAQIASGLRVANPSDDSAQASTISQFQTLLNRISGHKQRISFTENLLTQQEGAISSAKDIMIRAKEIAAQASNESYSVAQRRQLATEVWTLRDAMVSAGNTQIMGRYIFGGTDDNDPPLDLNATPYTNPTGASVSANQRYLLDADTGWNGVKTVAITDDETIRVTPQSTAFLQRAVNALERLGRSLEGYRTTPEVSTANPDLGGVAFVFPNEFNSQTSAIRNSLDQVQSSIEDLISEQSDIGGRMNRLDQAKQLLNTVSEAAEKNRSDIQDADVFELSSRLSSLQTSFQALLATGSQINRLSLLDYL
jgi:flagellar hook-associated protein 3 FlgL